MPPNPPTADADARYLAGLQLVQQLEANLAYGRPLCTKSGRRLVDLEDAVQAALADELPPLSSGEGGRGGEVC